LACFSAKLRVKLLIEICGGVGGGGGGLLIKVVVQIFWARIYLRQQLQKISILAATPKADGQ